MTPQQTRKTIVLKVTQNNEKQTDEFEDPDSFSVEFRLIIEIQAFISVSK
jgi:hypothetical protein